MSTITAPLRYPKRAKEPVRVMRDGREVCDLNSKRGMDEYLSRKRAMWERQHHVCCICRDFLSWKDAFFEHENGRGSGGGHRDDRIEVDGKWQNGAAHALCNSAKGSRRGTYNEQFYEVP